MKHLLTKVVTAFILIFITSLTVLYSEGWRLNYLSPFSPENEDPSDVTEAITKTGMIAVRSIPDGAKVYIDNKLLTATDDTITNLIPNKYNLKVEKEGYETWQKEVNVYSDLVTDITAVLILQSPKLEPLTNIDVNNFDLSNSQNNIIFTSANPTQPGLWMLPLNRTGLNIFVNENLILAEDTPTVKPSTALQLAWSIDDKSIVITNADGTYSDYQYSNNRISNTAPIKDLVLFEREMQTKWEEDFLADKLEILERQKAPLNITSNVNSTMGQWAPDGEKFYLVTENKLIVYNTENPLPVGEKRIYETLLNFNPEKTKAYWYSDSYHFILVEEDEAKENYYTISLVRIDGTNKTTVYSGNLASDKAFSSPSGDRIIVLTSLKENNPTNLYSIGLR